MEPAGAGEGGDVPKKKKRGWRQGLASVDLSLGLFLLLGWVLNHLEENLPAGTRSGEAFSLSQPGRELDWSRVGWPTPQPSYF